MYSVRIEKQFVHVTTWSLSDLSLTCGLRPRQAAPTDAEGQI